MDTSERQERKISAIKRERESCKNIIADMVQARNPDTQELLTKYMVGGTEWMDFDESMGLFKEEKEEPMNKGNMKASKSTRSAFQVGDGLLI